MKKIFCIMLCLLLICGNASLALGRENQSFISQDLEIPDEIIVSDGTTSIYNDGAMNEVISFAEVTSEIDISGDINFATSDQIQEYVGSNVPLIYNNGTNRAPVAELKATILNPESMVNGHFTTETQIAWLWEFNGEKFTYDPDGDAIVNMSIGGISSDDIIGTINGGIGFATQCKTPAQYILTFKVQDSKGEWSNTAQYVFEIEPIDGNTRPVCHLGTSSRDICPKQPIMISWEDSVDDTVGDQVTGFNGVAIKDGNMTNISEYVIEATSTNCVLTFPDVGDYEIRGRVVDSHGAWSNWVVFDVKVSNAVLKDIHIDGIESLESQTSYWVRQKEARNFNAVSPSDGGAQYLCDNFGSHALPSHFPSKMVMDTKMGVSGYVTTENGTPVRNATVRIEMPIHSNRSGGLYKLVSTDSNGYFSYRPETKQYWVDLGLYESESQVNLMFAGTILTEYSRYSRSTGTNFVEIGTITVSAMGQSYSEDVIIELGYSQKPIIGNLMYHGGSQWTYV